MKEFANPFEHDAAANLPEDVIEEVYIEDHNFSRFILSNRNIYLLGERGSGKSMMFIYNSFRLYAKRKMGADYDYVGIHVQCKRALFNKPEHELLDNKDLAGAVSEHYLVLVVLDSIANAMQESESVNGEINAQEFYSDFEYLTGDSLPQKNNVFDSLRMYAQKSINKVEMSGSAIESTRDNITFHTFHSLIVPVLELLRSTSQLKKAHFMLMIDDAHDLNDYQIRKINSWVAYRDNSVFSIKVATANVYRHSMQTEFGGHIVDGHDFMSINMEKSFQNSQSSFYRLAKEIVERRLRMFDIPRTAEEFFPESEAFTTELERCRVSSRAKYIESKPDASGKQISDQVYKDHRVEYFRSRSAKANRPPYSGFEILVATSTGVIRNLLSPCFSMYDTAVSENKSAPNEIQAPIQTEILMKKSDALWTRLRECKLADELIYCTEKQAREIHNLFEGLGDLFTDRLKSHKSEPRVLTFTVSGMTDEYRDRLDPILSVARRAQLLYERSGPSKDSGRRETFYSPNRLLWIARGLDPVGQHGRASIPAKDLCAALDGRPLTNSDQLVQPDLLDGCSFDD